MFQKVEGDQSQNFLTPTVQAFLIILTSAIRSLIKRNRAGRWQGSKADNWAPSSLPSKTLILLQDMPLGRQKCLLCNIMIKMR